MQHKRRQNLRFGMRYIMDITQLRYFLKTAELLNYSKAADALFIARQSLRQAIAELEDEIGAPLFKNVRNKISLTEHGLFLVQSAGQVVASFDKMNADMQKLRRSDLSLSVAIAENLFPFIFPGHQDIINSFNARFPNIKINIISTDSDNVISAVKSGDADCGCLIQMPYARPLLNFHVFQQYDAAVAHNDAFDGRRRITLKDLLTLPCIGMGSMENIMHPIFEECRDNGWGLDYSVVSSAIDAYYLTRHGKAVGFDIMVTVDQKNDPTHFAVLEGYQFAFGVLYPASTEKDSLIALFCQLIENEYIKYKC